MLCLCYCLSVGWLTYVGCGGCCLLFLLSVLRYCFLLFLLSCFIVFYCFYCLYCFCYCFLLFFIIFYCLSLHINPYILISQPTPATIKTIHSILVLGVSRGWCSYCFYCPLDIVFYCFSYCFYCLLLFFYCPLLFLLSLIVSIVSYCFYCFFIVSSNRVAEPFCYKACVAEPFCYEAERVLSLGWLIIVFYCRSVG